MSNRWNYGDAYKEYELTNQPYYFEDGSIVQVHDLFNPLPDFMKKADVIFVDPPWNKGNLSTFYTKADLTNNKEYKEFYDRVFECIEEIRAELCFVEIGKEYLADYISKMKKLYKYVTFYNSMYYNKKDHFCYIVQGSNKRKNFHLDYLDEEKIIKWICENIEFDYIADLCMGRGLVAYYASLNNKKFLGTELNKKRLAVTIKRVKTKKK